MLTGEEIPLLCHYVADRLEGLLLHTERTGIPGASHISDEDYPAAYNAAVLSFPARHRTLVPQPVQQAVPVDGLKHTASDLGCQG